MKVSKYKAITKGYNKADTVKKKGVNPVHKDVTKVKKPK